MLLENIKVKGGLGKAGVYVFTYLQIKLMGFVM